MSKDLKGEEKKFIQISEEREFQGETNTKPCGDSHKPGVLVSVSKQVLNDDSEQTRG